MNIIIKQLNVERKLENINLLIYWCKNGELLVDYFLDSKEKFVAAFISYKNVQNGNIMVEDNIYKCSKYPFLYMTDIYLHHYMDDYNSIESSNCFFKDGRNFWENHLIPTAFDSGFKVRLINKREKKFYPITKNNFEEYKKYSKGENMLYGIYR